jgi:hypothetical protein
MLADDFEVIAVAKELGAVLSHARGKLKAGSCRNLLLNTSGRLNSPPDSVTNYSLWPRPKSAPRNAAAAAQTPIFFRFLLDEDAVRTPCSQTTPMSPPHEKSSGRISAMFGAS